MNSGQGYTYDAAGNTLTDANGQSYIYDGENKQTKASNGGGTLGEYWYDGDGKRVKKIVPDTGEVTVFVYDAAGKQIAEYSTIVESVEDAKVAYLTSDHLGSPRINTDRDGAVTSRHDYHPYGEEIITAQRTSHDEYTPDSVRKQFTEYERDSETNLHFAQARYQSSNLGRFSSPDPLMASADIGLPQTFNRYAYVINNPLNLVDPTGMAADDCPKGKTCKTDEGGNLVYINDDGQEIVVGPTTTIPGVKPQAPPKIPPNTPIIEPSRWEMFRYYVKKIFQTQAKSVVTVGRVAGAAATILLNPTTTGCGASPGMVSDGNGGCRYDPNVDLRQTPDVDTRANPDTTTNSPTTDPNRMPLRWWTCLARGHLTPIPPTPGKQEKVEATGSGPSRPDAARNARNAVQSTRRDGWYVRHIHIVRCWRGR